MIVTVVRVTYDRSQVESRVMTVSKVTGFYQKYLRWIPIVSFVLGFIFDMVMLRRIDEFRTLIQQALYLIIAALLIAVELTEVTREVRPPEFLKKIWKYREALLHFLLGTLLNSYTIFYFKSASALTSFTFIFLLVGLLIFNEFLRFGKSQIQVHVGLLSLCLISYLVSLAPIVLGFIGLGAFLSSVVATVLIFAGYLKLLMPILSQTPAVVKSHLIYPFGMIQVTFVALYFAHAIPPVPLSVPYMGIYHGVEKRAEGGYRLTFTRSAWRFWENGDETFLARPGDTVVCFVQVYSPARFKDELQVRWLYSDEKLGWQSQDVIPLPVVGGREEGYRGVMKKNNYRPGLWRVQVETRDSREIGRISLSIVADDATNERSLHTLIK